MREIFTYGSVGGASGNRCSYLEHSYKRLAAFLFETFKEDVTAEVIPIRSYATSVRRKIVDIGAKIVKKSHMITLKLSQSVMQAIKFDKLWANCQNPSPILI
ncbi:hypothetical protein BuS5_02048 [Desulfosarcina sp. BuS5]|uniref:hypothetical protein n=1 Tax=Desulfosarcina sp. BuS5 TaxID=933262 RepID=UPI002378BA32|nr:hypothetical protein [Desulfosarcina sp. BuS5]WDN89080.1 hypothetical protein BuS5_02048 [Desulfosarcina sp. BuS5]